MTDLDARYGRRRARSRRERILGWSVGIAVLLAATLGIWWVGTDPASTQLQSRTVGYEIADDTAVEVIYEVSVDPGTEVSCTIEALSTSYGVVGWVRIDLPPSDTHTTTYVQDVRTSEQATTGLASDCWLP